MLEPRTHPATCESGLSCPKGWNLVAPSKGQRLVSTCQPLQRHLQVLPPPPPFLSCLYCLSLSISVPDTHTVCTDFCLLLCLLTVCF